MAVFRAGEDGHRRLLTIAEKCADAALAGDMQAIKEIGDRLDGKPAQESTVTIEKRDATDWTRAELVAVLDNEAAGSERTSPTNGRDREPDSLH